MRAIGVGVGVEGSGLWVGDRVQDGYQLETDEVVELVPAIPRRIRAASLADDTAIDDLPTRAERVA